MYEILFQYGPITIATFNLFLAVAFVIAVIFLVRFVHLKRLNLSFIVNNFHWLLILPLLGGRIFYLAEHFAIYRQNPVQMLYIWDMGFSRFGIFYLAAATLLWLSKKSKENLWIWLDALVLSGLSALFFIHVGHFFSGTYYGTLTDLPWGIAFDTITIKYTDPIHPTQLYSALLSILIISFGVKAIKRVHLTGVVGNLAIMVYSLGAFGIDFLHGSPSTYARINYLLIATVAFILYIHCSHKKIFDNQ